jgi:CubicO group peptidase (beta-lactamase class C family)
MRRRLAAALLCVLLEPLLPCAGGPSDTDARRTLVEPGHTTWNFQHMSELFPTRTVSRSGPVHVLERRLQPLGGVRYEFDGAERTIEEFLERSRTAGIVVLAGGDLVFERYRLGADPSTRFTSWSVAKSFVATLVGIARAEGKIASLRDPIVRYLPELTGTAWDGVSIEHALQMSSGVRFSEVYTDDESDVVSFVGLSMLTNQMPANEVVKSYPRAAEPGTVYNYSTVETQVLGWLLREATGMPVSRYLEERLWSRLGMEHDATWIVDRNGPDGMEMAGCCLNAALRDWARFGQLHAQDGVWRGERVLAEGWVAEATVPGAPRLAHGAVEPPSPAGYQYQWWSLPGHDRAFSAQGVFGQFIYVNPARGVVIAKASVWPEAWNVEYELETWAAFGAIVRALDGVGAAGSGG